MSGRRPESVLVIVTAADHLLLVLRRRSPPDFWQSVTGAMEWHEHPVEAARRELHEEIGVQAGESLTDLDIRFRFPIVGPWRQRYPAGVRTNLEHAFWLPVAAPFTPSLQPTEHVEHAWLSLQQALERLSSETNRRAARLAMNRA